MTEVGSRIPPVLQILSTLIEDKPQDYVRGSDDIQSAALAAAQYIFDLSLQSEKLSISPINELLNSLDPSEAPQTRSKSKKRKRSPDPPAPKNMFKPTPLDALFTDGLDDDQIWAQLDLKAKHMGELLQKALEPEPEDLDEADEKRDEALQKALAALGDGEQSDFDFGDLSIDESDEDESEFSSGDLEDDDEDDELSGGEGPQEEAVMDLKQDIVSEVDISDEDYAADPSRRHRKPKKARSELDDGFFDLRAFNADADAAESRAVSSGKLDGDDDDSEEDIDLFAPVDDDDGSNAVELVGDSREAYYDDFFAPPRKSRPTRVSAEKPKSPKKGGVRFHEEVRVRKIKARGKNLPLSSIYEDDDDDDEDYEDDGLPTFDDDSDDSEDDSNASGSEDSDDDVQEASLNEDSDAGEEGSDHLDDTIDRFKDDLFANEDEDHDKDMTTHEKRLAALQEQISTLEDENVGKKDWTLMGEASTRSRPQNSLLEEDLEFERVMKATPIITEEVVKGLEERIKVRIMENDFDDVVRRRAVEDKPFLPSRLFELKDTKSAQSLAQIYEDEYMAAQSGSTTDDRDGKLKKEHDEIDKLWENICFKLDSLCNAHFTPKQPKATISSISNVSTTTLESALPTTQSNSTMLAPEEVFKPSMADLKARTEMTPAEKRVLRGKVRKANKKRRDSLDKAVDKYAKSNGGVKKQKEAALQTAVKSGKGVTVVGKQRKDILQKNKKKPSP